MMFYKKIKSNINFYIILLLFILLFLSINTKAHDLIKLYDNPNPINIINVIRFTFPFLVILFSIFFFKSKIFFFKNINKYNILLILFFFLSLQTVGLVNNPKNYLEFIEYSYLIQKYNLSNTLVYFFYLVDQNYLILCSIAFLLVIKTILELNDSKILSYIIYINYIIIFLVFFPLGLSAFHDYLISGNLTGYWNFTTSPETLYFEQASPRVTGLSRSLVLIQVFFLSFFLFQKKSKLLIKILAFIFIILCGLFVWNLQSRGGILLLFLTNLLIIYFWKSQTYKKVSVFLALIIFPVLLNNIVLYLNKKYFYDSYNIDNKIFNNFFIKKNKFSIQNKNLDLENISQSNRVLSFGGSGRYQIWINSIKLIKSHFLTGLGPLADYWYLDRERKWSNNASNGFLYSWLCAGVFGALCYMLIFLNSIILLIKKYKSVAINRDYLAIISYSLIILFLIRSLFENSFMLFGVDFVFFFTSYFYLKFKVKHRLKI